MGRPRKTLRERFESRVAPQSTDGGCRIWLGAIAMDRYGLISSGGANGHGGRSLKAHRVAWEFAYGPIPDGMLVCHHCDNPPCCEPSHLFLGTPADNNADRSRKGRTNRKGFAKPRGEKSATSKLSDAQRDEIRALAERGDLTQAEIARRFGIVHQRVSQLLVWRRT